MNFPSPFPNFRIFSRRPGWAAATVFVGLAALAAAGLWRNSLRPENCYHRGRRALEQGDRVVVLRESHRLTAIPGFEGHGRLLAGLQYVRDGRMIEALQELRLAAQAEALAVEATTAAAQCFYLMDRYQDTIDTARAALLRDAEALEARRWLAAACYDLGAAAAATAQLKIISAKAPADPRPDRLLGLIGKDAEHFGDAVEHYRESLRRDPHQGERDTILIELAESLIKLGRFEEAQGTLRECDRTAPALTLAAECAQILANTDNAEDQLREALELDPQYIPARLQQGALYLQLGRIAEGIVELEVAVRRAPHNSQAHFHLAQAYRRAGQSRNADDQLQLMQECQAVELEFSELHKLASANTDDADIRYQMGVLAGKLDKPALARMWFRAAVAIQPDHKQARTALKEADASNPAP